MEVFEVFFSTVKFDANGRTQPKSRELRRAKDDSLIQTSASAANDYTECLLEDL